MIDTFCTLQSIKNQVLLPRFAAKRRSNLRGRASKNNAFCFSRRRCDRQQYSRTSKRKQQIIFCAKPCPFACHKRKNTNSCKKHKIKFFCPAFLRRLRAAAILAHKQAKQQILSSAKPCPFVRHKRKHANSCKKNKKSSSFTPLFSERKAGETE